MAIAPRAIVRWLRGNRALRTANVRAVTIGGLRGVVVDLRVGKGWRKTCFYSNGTPVVPLMSGRPPSGLGHNLQPGQVTRLYLLRFDGGVLAIEVVDISDAGRLDRYSEVVARFAFG